MLDIPYLLRATARFIEKRRMPDSAPPNSLFVEGEWHDDEPFVDDELGCSCGEPDAGDDPDWRRWYDSHRHDVTHVPTPVVDACIEEIREATVLHAVAVLEIARKWGLGLER